jgi:hypothetical protein
LHLPPGGLSAGWTQAANDQGTNFRNAIEVTVDVDHAHAMVERGLGDEEIGDRRPVPHAVVVREVLLEPQCPIENVVRWGHDLKVRV